MGGFSGTANSILVLNNDAVQVALTGTGANTSETVLKTVTLPALAANSSIEIDTLLTWTNSANTKTLRIRLGGLTGAIVGSFPVTTNASQQTKTIVRNVNNTAIQKIFSIGASVGYGVSSQALTQTTANTSSPLTLVFTGQLDAAAAAALDSIRYEGSTVKVIL
jgi:hypothetical protein